MFLIGGKDDILNESSQNIPGLNLEIAEHANTYDLMISDVLILMRSAVDKVKSAVLGS
jgi:ribosomal protein L4